MHTSKLNNFRRALVIGAMLTLGACASASNPNGIFDMKYVPPTAQILSPACAVTAPTPADQNACMLYHLQVFNCGLNLNAVGGTIQGAAMLVPGYGQAAAMGLQMAQPIINAAQLQICLANGFITPAAAPAAPITVSVPMPSAPPVKMVAPAQVAPEVTPLAPAAPSK